MKIEVLREFIEFSSHLNVSSVARTLHMSQSSLSRHLIEMEKELKEEINRFLSKLPKEKRYIFILRYWYADSVSAIAGRFQMSRDSVSVTLNRTRKQLRAYLAERGYDI